MNGKALNPEQRQAVEHGAGPALLVAGAGTGKTRVITERIAHLIKHQAAEPYEILALTFTEKAAREMAERLYDLIGWQSYQVAVLTFHAFGAELLGRYASHMGRSVRGGLINDTQKALLLQQHLGRVELSYYGPQTSLFEFLESVIDYIGRLQNADISSDDYAAYVAGLNAGNEELHAHDINEQHDLSALYSLYEGIKAETGTYDFNDQLHLSLQILQQKPNIAARLARQYCYVLVDEYQDTNAVQDSLLRSFVPPDGNLFAVGDDDQAIYGFRGAEIGNILAFADYYKVSKPVALSQNYRSGQEILDAAYRMIVNNNPDRLEAKLGLNKRLQGQHDDAVVKFTAFPSAQDEIEGIQEALAAEIAAGAKPSSLAVLSATHAPLLRVAKGLRSRGLPFALSTRISIFEQPELNQLWYLLEWIGLKTEEESIAHVLLSRFMGWNSEMYRRLLRQSHAELTGIEDRLRLDTSPYSHQAVASIDRWRTWARENPISLLAYRLVFETGVGEQLVSLAKTDTSRVQRVFEDLGRLFTQMQDYESLASDPTLAGYLSSFPHQPTIEVSEPLGDSEGIQLLTVHASKGLEFDTVYIINCTQRSWSKTRGTGLEVPPSLIKHPELSPEHELRRLMYVATTRARKELYLSASIQTGGGNRQTVSPLIGELLGTIDQSITNPQSQGSELSTTVNQLQRFYPLKHEQSGKLPFVTEDGWLELSVSALAGYDFCPYDFYLEKVLGISHPYGPQLAFGTVLHRLIEDFYQGALQHEPVELAQLQGQLDELWTDAGYETKQQAKAAKTAARTALENFYNRATADLAGTTHIITASELPFTAEITEAKLRIKGKIDAVFTTPEGIEIRDFKTGRKTDAESLARSAKNSFQLRTYALAYQEMTGSLPAFVALDYVVTGKEGRAELSPRIVANHRDKLTSLAADIRANKFAPKPSNVHTCAAIRYYGTGEVDDLQVA